MLNYLWGGMIILGILIAAFTGRTPDITNAAIGSSKEAVTLCITMLGIMSMWSGLMKIAEDAGLIDNLCKKARPVLTFLFPDIPDRHPAQKYIATNLIANMLGLGWAATPAGLKAMKELQKLNKNKLTASKSMCMFLIVNMSSVQLVSVNIIAYRLQYGSVNPADVLAPGLFATFVSTLTAIVLGKILEWILPAE